ncbi:DUF6463 family protein [Nocardia gipuzkoensis]
MNSTKRLLRWASGIMLVLGTGHLLLLALASWEEITAWVDRGMWAAVPLERSGAETVESLRNKLTFWAGPGSFAVPLILLGLLIRHLAGRGVAVPAWIGWGLAVWCLLGGILLVPSPYFVGVIAGVLVIWAARQDGRSEGAAGSTSPATERDALDTR